MGWLQEQAVKLLEHAMGALADPHVEREPDHGACTKYMSDLTKMLPRGDSEDTKSTGELAREEMSREETADS